MTAETSTKKRSLLWLAAGIAVVVLAVVGIRFLSRDAVPVRVASPRFEDLLTMVSTNGTVEPIRDFVAYAPVPGNVGKVNVRSGDLVASGTLILSMDAANAATRVAAAQTAVTNAQSTLQDTNRGGTQDERITMAGELERAKVSLANAQRDMNALEQLQARGAASSSEVDATRARLATAKSNVETLQQRSKGRFSSAESARASAQLSESKALLNEAHNFFANTVVRTPLAGTVYSLPVKQYDFVNGGGVLARVADLSQMQVKAYFDEPEIGKLALNQPVVITWEARPGRIWHGHISRTPATVIDYGTRHVGECIIAVDDASGDLLPNTNVNVKVTTQQKMHVLAIPREGLRTQGVQNFAYRVVNGKLLRTPVQLGALNLTLVEITSGLSESDTVALNATNTADLQDGIRVKPVK